MQNQLVHFHPRSILLVGLFAFFTGVALEAGAQSIPNPSFEADTFSNFPGYANGNGGGITGWVLSEPARMGLNPAGGSPFADNGVTPNGANVAFLQSDGAAITLSTTITGLTPGTPYRVSFRANRRAGYGFDPNPSWSLNGGAFISFTAAPAVGGANPYYTNTGVFTATNTTAALSIRNQTAEDSTLLVDNFSIEVTTVIVTNTANSGPGSLREAIIEVLPNGIIAFAPNLSGSNIVLTSEIVLSKNLTIDAGSLPAGITLSGGPEYPYNRIFSVNSGATVSLLSLTLTDGVNWGGPDNGDGGAIFNRGTLTLTRCTLFGNYADGYGGAIRSYGPLALTHCTVAINSAFSGGAIYSSASLALTHCTVSSNYAYKAWGEGGGVVNYSGFSTLTNTIVAGNTAASDDGNNISGSFTGNNNFINGDPLLAPLGNYGGPTRTMLPLSGSPAIDTASVIGQLTTDQRGFPRLTGPSPDIGAVEVQIGPVTTTANSGPGSLRYVTAHVNNGSTITFGTNLSGSNIVLTNEIVLSKNLTIDGGSLPAGITVDGGPGNNRIFTVASGTTVSLLNLTLTGGNGAGAAVTGDGGAILSHGTLTLTGCTLFGNSAANYGGAIETYGPLVLTHCTLSGNSAPNGGAIDNYSSTVTLMHSTISGNSASSWGGGLVNYQGTLTLTNTIASGNTAPNDPNISGGFTGINNLTTVDALLSSLGSYGGSTRTMLPLLGSPAIDAAAATAFATDQRGLPRVAGAAPDIGAVEWQGTLLVTTNADSGPGSLRQAIVQADSNGTITFATNLSGGNILLSGGQLLLNKNLIIDATALSEKIQINGNGAGRVFEVATNATVVLSSLTMTNGSATEGGGIYNAGSLTLNQITLAGNTAIGSTGPSGSNNNGSPGGDGNGGGIYNKGSLILDQSTVSGNSVRGGRGGDGIYQAGDGGTGGNGNGGGIYNAGTLTMNKSTASGNSASGGNGGNGGPGGFTAQGYGGSGGRGMGGGIYNVGNFMMEQVTLSANSVARGLLGIGRSGGNRYDGEAYYAVTFSSGTMAMVHCTISGNSRSPSGLGAVANSGTLTLTNSIVANNPSSFDENISGSFTGSNNLVSGNPLLSPLGNYGGLTKTMPPLPGSPAIDGASVIAGLNTDQRGFARILGASPDIGAVEAEPSPLVTTAADSGLGSLRYAATYVNNNSTITFASNLSGSNIVLASEIALSKNLTIDASSLTAGITVNGGAGDNRIFSVNSGMTISLFNLTLTGGNGGGTVYSGEGGAILNQGTLALTRCTLSGNSSSSYGGAITTRTPLALTHCTLSGNSAPNSGAIDIYRGSVQLVHCTISGNSASSQGGAMINLEGTLLLNNTIAAGNTAPTHPNIYGTFTGDNNLTSGDPLVGGLGNYGGSTKTMPPLSGSPAIDAASVIGGLIADQRGYPRNAGAAPDIGAVEGAFNSAMLLSNPTRLSNGTFQLNFANLSGPSYTILGTTNLALPPELWLNLGPAVETPSGSGQFRFTDPQGPNHKQRFYRVKTQ